MKKIFTLLCCFSIAWLCLTTTAQLKIEKNTIKSFATHQGYTPAAVTPARTTSDSDVPAKAYAIRVYEDTRGGVQEFVSFDINNTADITIEKDLSQYYIRAAAEAEGYYYMINSMDGMCSYDLLRIDLETMNIDTVASYTADDYEAGIIFLDMTYDPAGDVMYGIGYDLETATESDEEGTLNVDLALVTIDLTTGSMTSKGHQGYCNLAAIAADAEGYLWGLSSDGSLWDINKNNGKPGEEWGTAGDKPVSLQSMCFNHDTGILYWAGFSTEWVDGEEKGKGFLSQFIFGEDAIQYTNMGSMANNSELIGLYIDSNPIAANTPEAVLDLTVTPAANGVQEATLAWINPSTLINGENINTALTVTIYRDNELIATLENQAAGQSAQYTDKEPSQGTHEYMVVCANENGTGQPTYIKNIFIGRDIPGNVTNLVAVKTTDKNEVTVSWEKPRTGINNGWYDEESLRYTVVRYPDNKLLAEVTTSTTLVDTDFTTLRGYYYEVTVKSVDGVGPSVISNTVVAGPALDTPYECDFSTDDAVKMWSVIDGDEDGHEWFPASYSKINQHFMKFAPDSKYNPQTTADDWLITPPINLKGGTTYTFEYEMLLLGPLFPVAFDITIGKKADAESQSTILDTTDSLVINMAFEPRNAIFEVENDGEYYLAFHIRNAVMVQVTNVVIRELESNNLSLESFATPIISNVNSECIFDVAIKNCGASDLTGNFFINVCDENNTVVASYHAQSDEIIASQETKEYAITWIPQETGTHTYTATVGLDDNSDSVPEDNTSEGYLLQTLEEGVWSHVAYNNALMNYLPFVPSYKYNYAETIYAEEEIGSESCYIKGIMYYTYVFNNLDVKNFNAIISLAHTTLDAFDDNEPIEGATQVYKGTIKPTSTSKAIYIAFDEPFNYQGGNLCVMTTQEAPGGDNYLMFYGSREEDEIIRSRFYSSDEAAYAGTGLQGCTEIANISFFKTNVQAVESIEEQYTPDVFVANGLLIVDGEYDTIKIYSIDGRLCATHASCESVIPMTQCEQGVYVIEVINNNHRTTTKVVL